MHVDVPVRASLGLQVLNLTLLQRLGNDHVVLPTLGNVFT